MTVMGSSARICPICNKPGSKERKWTRKKSGKRYDYEVFHHESTVHWVRIGANSPGRVEKDDTRKKLIGLLNTTGFRRAIFTIKDIAAEFEKGGLTTDDERLRRSLSKLVESGLLLIIRRNRKVYFINSTIRERLEYIMKRVDITLEDSADEGTFERHYFRTSILNDSEFPLHYIQFRATGDNVRDRGKLSFNSYDLSRKEKAVIYFLEDNPQLKRILIELREPILPNVERTMSIEYFWPEIGPSYMFTSPTPTDFFRFSLVSRGDFEMTVTRTNSGRTVVEDLSSRVISTTKKDNLNVETFEMVNLPAFAVLKFKWKRHEKT
jgi:hypothetical protein